DVADFPAGRTTSAPRQDAGASHARYLDLTGIATAKGRVDVLDGPRRRRRQERRRRTLGIYRDSSRHHRAQAQPRPPRGFARSAAQPGRAPDGDSRAGAIRDSEGAARRTRTGADAVDDRPLLAGRAGAAIEDETREVDVAARRPNVEDGTAHLVGAPPCDPR